MNRDDDDDEAKKAALIDEAFETLKRDLQALSDRLGDLNSLYPATKAFLKRCGVSHVKELTPEQTVEYKAYLQAEHDALFGAKKPPN